MASEESYMKIKELRKVTDLKLQNIKQHSQLIDMAFEKLANIQDGGLDNVKQTLIKIDNRFKNREY